MRVNVDEQAINEPRIKRMARRLGKQHGRDIHHAEVLGRLISVWMLCYSRRSPVLRMDDVDITSEMDGFAEAMVLDEMADTLTVDGPPCVHVRGVAERIAFLERQSERGRKGGKVAGRGPEQQAQARLFAEDEALAKRVLERTQANAERHRKQTLSERLRSPQAYSPDLDQAPDQAPDQDHPADPDPRQPVTAGKQAHGSPVGASDPQTTRAPDPEKENAATGKPGGKAPRPVPDQALTLAHLLLIRVCENNPSARITKAPEKTRDATAERWAQTIDLMHRRDGHEWGEIQAMISWSQGHEFWKTVILGADNLRDKWDTMAAQRHRPRGAPASTGPRAPQASPTALALADVAELEAQEQAQERAEGAA